MAEKERDIKPVVRVSAETRDAIKQVAEEMEISLTEAAEQLISSGLLARSYTPTAHQASKESVLSEPTLEALTEYAKENSMTLSEAAHRLVTVAIGRLKALKTYVKKTKKEA